jgi:polyribonucleotide nucleotidyltransferase
VGYVNGEYVLNPGKAELANSKLDLVVAGTEAAVLMVESEADQLTEEIMLGAVVFGHDQGKVAIDAIHELVRDAGKPEWLSAGTWAPPAKDEVFIAKVNALAEGSLRAAYQIRSKQARTQACREAYAATKSALKAEGADFDEVKVEALLFEIEARIVRSQILAGEPRIDGRDTRTVRPIEIRTSVLPRTHGSALFTRGETQALVTATLGTGDDEQIIDALEGEYREHFLLHYNFPPYSVGETGRMGSPGRREVGHGKLAWRAVHPLLPAKDKFPYTLRVVSEITESNGSSSMATVCGASLALMDAGVPLARPVAGIAMGLIKEDQGVAVLSDILGDEDHLGDMDFKVAGTEVGVTSLQMDLKITSINEAIMKTALGQARDGRLHILGEMAKGLAEARGEVSRNAPRITTFTIPKEKIREVIGTGGKVIREITEVTGCKIDIEDDGTIKVASADGEKAKQAIDWIKGIVAEPEMGAIYTGKVVKTMDFGAFVNFMGSRDGLVHISELAPRRVEKTTDVVKIGDQVKVKLIGFDDRGKVKLSMKRVDQATGEDISAQFDKPREPRSETPAG